MVRRIMVQPLRPEDLAADAAGAPILVIETWEAGNASCYQVGRVLELLAEHLPGVALRRLERGRPEAEALLQRLGVTETPTVLLWDRRGGGEVGRLVGVVDAGTIWGFLASRRGGPG